MILFLTKSYSAKFSHTAAQPPQGSLSELRRASHQLEGMYTSMAAFTEWMFRGSRSK